MSMLRAGFGNVVKCTAPVGSGSEMYVVSEISNKFILFHFMTIVIGLFSVFYDVIENKIKVSNTLCIYNVTKQLTGNGGYQTFQTILRSFFFSQNSH